MIPAFPQRGARIQDARPGRARELRLESYEPEAGLRQWVLSADPEDARWIEVFDSGSADRIAPAEGPHAAFVLLCRARLSGGRCGAFDQAVPEVPWLAVETPEGTYRLVADLDRRYPNVLLLDGEGRVVGAMRPSSKARPFALGEALPPSPAARPVPQGLARIPPTTREEARALDAHWNRRLAERDLSRVQGEARRAVKREVARLERRLANLESDRLAAAAAERFQRWGELLKIHGGRWRAGMTELRVPDVFAEGQPDTAIPLDPTLNLAGNITALFRSYRKRERAASHVERRLSTTRQDLDRVRAASETIAAARSVQEVEQAAASIAGTRRRGSGGTSGGAGPEDPAPPGPMERTSSDGLTILVGRSAEENDRLTFRIAQGRDWWLHALGWPGSHVVVRNPSGRALPVRTLREAAWLAAYFSKARRQGQVEVGYVERKHVRRVRHGKPGQVTYAHGRALWVDIEDSGLRRVLGPKEGEADPTDAADEGG